MKGRKLSIFYLGIITTILSSCATIDTSLTKPNMSFKEAITSMERAINDTRNGVQTNFDVWGGKALKIKRVVNVKVSEDGITFINYDNTTRHYSFDTMTDPYIQRDPVSNSYFVFLIGAFGLNDDALRFNHDNSAQTFADALYALKHMDIKAELAKEREERSRRQAAAENEKKEREREWQESLRRKTAVKDEPAATAEETPASSTTDGKSAERPTQPRKSVAKPRPRQPEGGSIPPPELPAGGALSGN